MPQNKPPLADSEIALISQWIAQGAEDDSPQNPGKRYDMEHPPEYTRLPVIPALAFSPDGSLLAVAGFHEVLLWKADGIRAGWPPGRTLRAVESLAFSPDGKRLAVTGGRPSRMGEVQVWDVAKRKLALSVPVTYDTIYGASWSPDGTKIAFGCADNTVRAIDAKTGQQVLFMGSHSDWAQDTVFSVDGIAPDLGRPRHDAKLTEVATQRFVDNITSITPGALKGGLTAVARHPKRDEIVIGGSDGEPKLYRVFRQTVRVIGDDSNLIREFPPLPGRVYSVAVSTDGKRIAAGSSLDGFRARSASTTTSSTRRLPENIKAINEKVVTSRSAAEKPPWRISQGRREADCQRQGAPRRYLRGRVPAGRQGPGRRRRRRHYPADQPRDGHASSRSSPQSRSRPPRSPADAPVTAVAPKHEESRRDRNASQGGGPRALDVQPREIRLTNRFAYVQLLVTGRLASGETIDATRMVETRSRPTSPPSPVRAWSGPWPTARRRSSLRLAGKSVELPVVVLGWRRR